LAAPIDVARLRAEILAWMSPPEGDRGGRVAGRQIRRLIEALERPSAREDLFLSSVAEAVLARRLLEAGCTIDFERPTSGGRHADFHVRAEGDEFYVHVKRIALPPSGDAARPLPPPEALVALARIARPVSVALRWEERAGADDLAELRESLDGFVRQASVGDEVVVRADDGRWLGAARIAAPCASGGVELRTGGDAGWEAAVPRVQRLLRKAYSQFMPGETNVVCLASDSAGALEAVETALLGTVVERWDRFPPRGQRVAHGRAEDGFWSRGQFAESELVSWFPVDSAVPACTWERPGGTPTARDARVAAVLRRVLA
jgi:hypothetical protein